MSERRNFLQESIVLCDVFGGRLEVDGYFKLQGIDKVDMLHGALNWDLLLADSKCGTGPIKYERVDF